MHPQHMLVLFVTCGLTCFILCGSQVLVFFCSLFGDLIESIMKRDAGMKVRHTVVGYGGHVIEHAALGNF